MKPKVIIIGLVALIATACSTSLQTGSNYIDDLYYWPGDNIPEISSEELTALSESTQPGGNTIIVSELEEGNDGTKTLNNYIYADEEPSWFNDVQAYNLDNIESEGNDTIFFTDEESGSYVVNNYYIDDDYSYADRIRRFHNPYYYDPDPYWNLSFNWGYSPYYSRWSYSYWDPWYYDSYWYRPYYSYGGWYGYNSWYSPYSYWGYSPYYSYYPYYYHHYPYHYNHYPYYAGKKTDYYNGERRSSRPNSYSGGGGIRSSSAGETYARSGQTVNKSATVSGRRGASGTDNMVASAQKSASTNRTAPQSEVLTEKRRNTGTRSTENNTRVNTTNSNTNRSTGSVSTSTAPRARSSSNTSYRSTVSDTKSTTTGTRSYTQSYNTPRSNTRATYNRSSQSTQTAPSSTSRSTSRSYTIPSTSSSSRSYTAPSSSSSRSGSSSSYKSSSSSSSSSRSYQPSSSSSSSRSSRSSSSYSAPSRSSSSSSYSSGSSSRSSYSSGSSSSSYSSGSSSSSSRSSSSSSSSGGRR